ncbi:MAG: acyl-CoA thioesterase [Spirochaetes bacterium]|nr:acyl-CoA thioesterase [Spirochaetota bacterium]
MKPKPFRPEIYQNDERFVRDANSGMIWHRCQHRTLYADTDRSEVVYHSNYLRYFELGRASLMRDAAYPYREIEESGFVYPIIDLGITFYRPLHYDDLIWIHTRPIELERVRLTFDYLITHADTGDLICRGFTRHCALNRAGRPVAVDGKTVHLWKTFPK